MKNDAIYVCGGATQHCIKVLNLEGEGLSFIPHLSNGSLRYIHLNDDGTKICYTGGWYDSPYITCLTKDGHVIFSVITAELKEPRSVVSDQTGNWLVYDEERNTIRVLNKDGVVCNTLMSQTDDFDPNSFCMDMRRDIMVVSLRSRTRNFSLRTRTWNPSNLPKLATFKLNYS